MLKQVPMTARFDNAVSVNRYLQRKRPEKNLLLYTAEPESQASVFQDIDTSLFLFSLKELVFNRGNRVFMIGMICHRVTYIPRLCYASCETYDALFTLLTTISGTY